MAQEEALRIQQALLDEAMKAKSAELQALEELRKESGFAPRTSLARTPPGAGFGTPLGHMLVPIRPESPEDERGAKRLLSSPEEIQEAVRRRTQAKRPVRTDVPPIGGLLSGLPKTTTPPPASGSEDEDEEEERQPKECGLGDTDPLATAPIVKLAGLATASTKGIMEAVKSKTSRLNKDEVAAIGLHTERISAVLVHMALRLAAAENRATAAEKSLAELASASASSKQISPPPPAISYASALRLPRNAEPLQMESTPGPLLAFYPAADNGDLKTAEETKAALKKAVDPAKLWVQVAKVRKVGNAGVLVQTTSDEAATRLRAAVPGTLRVTEPKKKLPLVCFNRLDGDPSFDEVLTALHDQNFREDPAWPLERIKKEATGAFKKNRSRGTATATAAIFACSAGLREALLNKGRVYVGWQAVVVTDYVDVTCCTKCQQYGHPERFCRSKETTCQRCGAVGHRGAECTAAATCCATCKRLGKKEAVSHRTASRDCPARRYAEERSVAMTNYG